MNKEQIINELSFLFNHLDHKDDEVGTNMVKEIIDKLTGQSEQLTPKESEKSKEEILEETMTDRILKILDNVRYWETCPDDYKKDIEIFLKAQNQPSC